MVDVVGAQELQRGGEGLSRGGGFVIRIVELGGQEDVLARQAGGSNGGAHPLLVAIGLGGIDVPIADLETAILVAKILFCKKESAK